MRINKKYKAVFLLTSLLLLWWSAAFSQKYYFREISVAEGLANEKIYTVFEDTDHFIWMGNGFGVSVYDGSEIVNYTTKDGLAVGGVKSIYQDKFGSILLGHYDGGLTQYKNHAFKTIDSLGITGHVYGILESDGFLWVITGGSGAYRIPQLTTGDGWNFKKVENYLGKDGLSDRIFDIIELKSGLLILVTDVGLKQFNPADNSFSIYKKEIIPAYFQITSILEASDGKLYIGTHNGGLYILDQKSDKIKFYDEKSGLSHNFIMDIAEDNQGLIWIGTFGGGLNVLNTESGEFVHFQGFHDKHIQSLLINYQGLLLVGTDASGLQIFKGFQFQNFVDIPGFLNTIFFDVENVGDALYGATEKGLVKLNFIDADYHFGDIEVFIPDITFNYIEADGDRGLWLASELNEVWYYDLKDNSYHIVSPLRPYFRINKITSFTKDELNRLWIGTIDGLLMYDPVSEQVERLSQENGILKNDISCVQAIGEKIWVGSRQSNAGINYILKNKVYRIDLPLIITPTAFLEYKDELWIGTQNQGIFVLRGDSISGVYSENEGLLSNHISFISIDKNEKIWVGSQKGLNCLIKSDDNSWMGFSLKQGFMGLDCSPGAYNFGKKDAMWIGTSQGIVLNHVDKIPMYKGADSPVIKQVLVNDNPVEIRDIIELNYNQNEIQIKFTGVELFAPERMKFSYKVDGLNQRWQVPGYDRRINLFAVPPGDYALHLKVIDYRGTSSELKAPLRWTINPPWYLSKWTFIGGVILIMLSFYGYVKFREQNLKREKRILEERVEERTREVVIKNNQLEQKNKDITDSLHYASRIQKAVLPATKTLEPYGFIYYRPKDIVSGDFYFIAREEKSIYICAADCTGHGVPGALLSIMGVNMMDRILATNPGIYPNDFLNKLNIEVAKTLRHDESIGVNDGMDLALIKIDCKENKLYYAGAFNSLYLIKDSELKEYKANRFSIGSQRVQKDLIYNNQAIDINWDERIYIFSDGLADQFGGVRQKKLKSSGLKKLLIDIQKYPITEQKDEISKFMRNWRGMDEQIDDILLIGLELTRELSNFNVR